MSNPDQNSTSPVPNRTGDRDDDFADQLARYRAIKQYIDIDLVRLTPRPQNLDGKVEAVRDFNMALGDPQHNFPSVQISGTSGKGSTAYFLARILAAAGYRTGLHISPYLQVINEKTWISGRLIDVPSLWDACERIRPVAERFRALPDLPASVHGMASLALSYVEFERQEVDIAVIETGMGGRFDLVQGLRKELCVITEIGLDHIKSLGDSLERIAWHKAGIMEADIPCLALRSKPFGVLVRESRRVGCPLIAVDPQRHILTGTRRPVVLDLPRWGMLTIWASNWPQYQTVNALMAAMTAANLATKGWEIAKEHVIEGLTTTGLPGRMEWMQHRPPVILDAAHNPQKMHALSESLPAGQGRRVLLLGVTGERNPVELVAEMRPLPDFCVCTEPILYGKDVIGARQAARNVEILGIPTMAVKDSSEALQVALDRTTDSDILVVTGSIYLLGEVRNHWYPHEEVLRQCTWFPRVG